MKITRATSHSLTCPLLTGLASKHQRRWSTDDDVNLSIFTYRSALRKMPLFPVVQSQTGSRSSTV